MEVGDDLRKFRDRSGVEVECSNVPHLQRTHSMVNGKRTHSMVREHILW